MNKKDKKKAIRITLIILMIIIPLAIFIACFVDWKFPDWIYVSGSSTIQPLMAEIAKDYTSAEIIVDAGGSSIGISNMVKNLKQIGMISKDPSESDVGTPSNYNDTKYGPTWEKDKVKTFTFAWDGIGIIYKTKQKLVNNFDINLSNFQAFFKAFTGQNQYYYDSSNQNIYSPSLDGSSITSTSLKIVPFAKTGGASLSGTAEAFLQNNPFHNQIDKTTKEILETGNYGKLTQATDESNLQTWNKINDYNLANNEIELTYLSSGFILNNLDLIKANGFQIATLNNQALINESTNELNFPQNYKWYRPFNLEFKINNMSNGLKQFIDWLRIQAIDKNSRVYQDIVSMGYSPLTTEQSNTMMINDNFFVSDYELINHNPNRNSANNNLYGAY